MRRTIDNVIPEIDEWQSKYGDFMYSVVAFFTNKEMVKANKKSKDAALELQGLLMETAQIPQDFVLESAGVSKAGNPKWKLLAFGPEGGPYTYSTLKDGQNVGAGNEGAKDGPLTVASALSDAAPSQRLPAPTNTEASIRASVALKAAAEACTTGRLEDVLVLAEEMDAWLAKKSGAPSASSSPPPEDASAPAPDPSSAASGDGEAPRAAGTTYEERWAKKFGTTE